MRGAEPAGWRRSGRFRAQHVIVPVILCGGAGTRLWPLSTDTLPKPFIRLVGAETTFAATLARVADPMLFAPPLVVASVRHRELVASELAGGRAGARLLLEPDGRDSGPAIAAAAALVAQENPEAVLLVLAADHLVPDAAAFAATVATALPAAAGGRIVTFGVRPAFPATAYGYLRPGPATRWPGVRAVAEFVEKPDAATAAGLIAAGCRWNSGNFMLRADVAGAAFAEHAPAVAAAAAAAVREVVSEGSGRFRLGARFLDAPRISFDYAVMEHTDLAAMVDADFAWSDLGSWDAVHAATTADGEGNARLGPSVLLDVRNSYVRAEGAAVAVAGLDNVVVVSGPGGVLVAARGRDDLVRRAAAALLGRDDDTAADAGAPAAASSMEVRTVLHVEGDRRIALLRLAPGAAIPPAAVAGRRHWLVSRGIADVDIGGAVERLFSGEARMIASRVAAEIRCEGPEPLEVVETEWREN